MEDLTKIVAARLTELFKNETQDAIAQKLSSTQSNISKYVNALQLPPADTLREISKAYNVSIDWILGISDDPEIDGVAIEKLTYEQTGRIIDYLIRIGAIEVPDLNELNKCFEEAEYSDEYVDEEVEVEVSQDPKYDSDFLKIKDRALSHILRRRLKMYDIGEDYADLWRETTLPIFKGVRVVKNSENMQAAMDSKNWAVFKDGDWVAAINELSQLSEEELTELVNLVKNKEKEGRENGR